MSDYVIIADKIFKSYHLFSSPMERLLTTLKLRSKKKIQEFIALREISFSIKKGETVGILGRNGSGKSTILKIIANITQEYSGNLMTKGTISAILELGTGFNPEQTGLQNIHQHFIINRQKIDKKIVDDIIAFSELEEFIKRPLKTYSSGMYARLAFAVAISSNPDILIIDEALSVGDAKFQQKCFKKIKDLQSSGTTILFVSHSLDSIAQLCNRAILLDKGSLVLFDNTKLVIEEYNRRLFGSVNKENLKLNRELLRDKQEDDEVFHILDSINTTEPKQIFHSIETTLLNKDKEQIDTCISGELISIKIDLLSKFTISNLSIAVEVVDKKGLLLTGESTFNKFAKTFALTKNKKQTVLFSFMSELIEDDYFIQVRVNRLSQKDRSDNILLYINEHAAKLTLTKNTIHRQWFKVKKKFHIDFLEN